MKPFVNSVWCLLPPVLVILGLANAIPQKPNEHPFGAVSNGLKNRTKPATGSPSLLTETGLVGMVRDLYQKITAFGFNSNGNDYQTSEHLGPDLIKDIWSTMVHYLGRHDLSLSSLETLEDIALEILNGFTAREKDTVYFYLYNRGRKGSSLIKYGSLDVLNKSTFAKGKPLTILLHGFKMNGFSHFNYLLTAAYMKHGEEKNVFNVDWRRLAGDYVYFNSAFNTRIVGERVGEMVVFLKRNGFIESYDQVHLVGFSLGAHVAGYTGKYLKKTERRQIGRITGLDPAGPSFAGLTSNSRLDKEDAKFVDVIHTSLGRSGIVESIGHVDFFPNGGADQPGCDWEKFNDFFLRNCSHERAFYLYLETIRRRKFFGCPCKSVEDFQEGKCPCSKRTPGAEIMGEFCNRTARGDKYLEIKEPYLLRKTN